MQSKNYAPEKSKQGINSLIPMGRQVLSYLQECRVTVT